MTDDDPLRNADLGDSATVRETRTFWLPALASDDADGDDRFADHEVVDTRVVTNSRGGRELRVTTESEVTKRLPRNWDRSDAPRTDSERRAQRRERWGSRVARLLPIPVTLGIGLVVTDYVFSAASQGMTVNGAPITYSPWDLVPVVSIVAIIAFIVLAIPHLPRMSGGRPR
jgi:hypothetical protein